jgi:hypothetical protein
MEYIEFFLFCLIAFGLPTSMVFFKYHRDKKSITVRPILESGIPQKLRTTNRHQNIFYPTALMMIFTFIPLLSLIPIFVLRHTGEKYDLQLLFSIFILCCSFLGYLIFRLSGGLSDN